MDKVITLSAILNLIRKYRSDILVRKHNLADRVGACLEFGGARVSAADVGGKEHFCSGKRDVLVGVIHSAYREGDRM